MANKRAWIIWIAVSFLAISATGIFVICAGYGFFWYSYLYLNRWPSQQQMVPSGYRIIPEAQQIDDLMPNVWHQVSNYKDPDMAEWQTEALFAQRYKFWMSVDVRVDRQSGEITDVLGKPRFMLHEVVKVVDDRTIGTSYGEGYEFELADWKKVVAADGDFSVIGIDLKRNQPVLNFDKLVAYPHNGIQMQKQ